MESPTFGIDIDESSTVRPFEQIRRQLQIRIEDGQLLAGDKLPPVRNLATALHLAPGTVARAYRELEAAGYLSAATRAGTTVSALAKFGPDVEKRRALAKAARTYVGQVRKLDVDLDGALEALRTAWKA